MPPVPFAAVRPATLAAPITITLENFEKDVLGSALPVLVDFWSQTCLPCKLIARTIDNLAVEYDGRLVVAKVNVDEEVEVANQCRIERVPTVRIYKAGDVAFETYGSKDLKAEVVQALGTILA